ncbi:adenylyl cyclase [Homoserinibacter sp. YIM 151385]|uniref:adenylyl cyclase n=1 Tax=Homoserinibacter sp. YIM 151385 TaxID=2985506 RepID=UPI0022F0D614|nr:adenylyl cyclase [Homoserinibacter sp. YIM 151385]WBU37339.1 adenylyl cyclase [Homoserinibacter sp. YIM 151385]
MRTPEHAPPRSAFRRRTGRLLGAGIATTALLAGGGLITAAGAANAAGDPDFGPNVTIIDPSWSTDRINTTLAGLADEPEFSENRHAVLFKPGSYGSAAGQDDPLNATDIVNADVGYYTSIAGLGGQPGDVHINGSLHVEPVQGSATEPWNANDPGSLTRFWRSMSNLQINPIQRPIGADAARAHPEGVVEQPHAFRWAVSQAAPMRRMDIQGGITLFGRYGAFSSGGYLANSKVAGTVYSGSQQQYFTRNSEIGNWEGGVWNMVFSGVEGAPAPTYPGPRVEDPMIVPNTVVEQTPLSREAPFLTVDEHGAYSLFAPNAKRDSRGVDWGTSEADGRRIPIDQVHIAKPGDSTSSINDALAAGKHLVLTPGIYETAEPLRITEPGTVVLGMGMASVIPTAGNRAIEIADVAGVQLSGITIDAGLQESDKLIEVGPTGSSADAASDPTTLTDVFVRIGGHHAGKAETSIEVNSDDVLLDNIWAWRGDHGNGIGWDSNTGAHGVVVNGDDVTATGLFVEHYQQEQTIWRGERGRVVFYQNEIPYDPPTREAWTDGTGNGYEAYAVDPGVQEHHATGMGVYSYFIQDGPILDDAITAPERPGVRFERIVTRFLNGNGEISHTINGVGDVVHGVAGEETHWLPAYPVG